MRNRMPIVAVLLIGLAGCAGPPNASNVSFYTAESNKKLDLPFSGAARVENLLFLSGQIGSAPGASNLVPGGITAETRQALENIKAILVANGSSLDRVVKCTAMLADINEWQAMNAVYRSYLPQKPARSAFGVTALVSGARVEIECIAASD